MNKKIILGVSGSIAAYRACDLARLFAKGGYEVYPVVTARGARLVSAQALGVLAGNPAAVGAWEDDAAGMPHIVLKADAALLVVAPATADIIGKFAAGIADDILSTTFLSVTCPVLIAPAMNPAMYAHPAVCRNRGILEGWGVHFVDPAEGDVACGDHGQGKLAAIDEIYRRSVALVQ